ncbi:T9SS type A sorting domain-containing protein [Aequorivita marisscotiae]|uniref:T9SS type A sorting domain-containing protein n=1 Tax=Aequorivita marisscotiae TaxID=3040348 RepID=A0ABY8KWI9_9FLAO|nr:T9SS type A sorting domain-containing protein [Aequorivita sp. Ant34-E75]WGF93768.1 T9SS type A sorting domain-containing protein [Aequorivita sp. Ant34-E75]
MKRNILVSLVLALITISLYAQDPNILWQRTIGGSEYDSFTSMGNTMDGGIIIGGYSESDASGDKTEDSNGSIDYWILKLDSAGSIEWQNTIGGNWADWNPQISQTSDGGYILGGYSDSNISGDKTEDTNGYYDYWIIKLNSTGNIEWQNTIGGNYDDQLRSFIQTSDGGFLAGGNSNSNISGDKTEDAIGLNDIWIVKLDSMGEIEWQNTIGGDDEDWVDSIKQTLDGGYILAGFSYSNISGDKTENSQGSSDCWILKLDSLGQIQWQNTIGGSSGDRASSVILANDGGYLIGASSDSNISGDKTEDSLGGSDSWIIKLDENGNILWQNTIGGDQTDGLTALISDSNNGYLIGTYSYSNISGDKSENSLGESDYWIIKINNLGIIEWQNTIGGNNPDVIMSLSQATNGSFFLGGRSASNISGDKTENSRGGNDFWILKHAETLGLEENPFSEAITLYPNPAKNTLQLNTQDKTIDQVNIYTMTGSKVLQFDVDTVSPTVDVSSLASGVYYLQLYSGKNVALKKFVKE